VRDEYLDRPDTAPHDLAGCLADIARINRLGPVHTLLHHLAPFLERHREPRPLRLLDVGTGGGDIPVAVVRWARRRGRPVSVLGLDLSPAVLAFARATARAAPEVRLVAAEALTPPVRPGGVDVAVCSLMLHHLPEPAVVRLLGVLASVTRLGFVVSDLRRSRSAWLAAWLLTRTIGRHRVTRHDGPLSVRRAYTPEELARLAAAAGLGGMRWHRAIAFRVVGVYARG
jgi:2-polyprenyl-3-methyl-5-hydroxy-6-metoxy-1,4-benzoquinol methylase